MRRRRVAGLAALFAVALTGWLGVRALQVRSHLVNVRSILARGGPSPTDQALARTLHAAQGELSGARRAVDDPVWRLAAAVPLAGRSFAAVRTATLVGSDLADSAGPQALRAVERARSGPVLTGGRVDLTMLDDLSTDLRPVARAVHRGSRTVAAVPTRWLPRPVARGLAELDSRLAAADRGLGDADRGLAIAPALLGANGPRRYFLAVQNNAEVRGTGGLVGAYAVVRVDHGAVTLDKLGTDLDFVTGTVPVTGLGAEYAARYGAAGPRLWSAVGLTPDWPSAGTVMSRLWQAQGGGHLDGVLGMDPVAIAELLSVTGPAAVDGRSIGAANVVDFVMRDEYAESAVPQVQRKDVLAQLAQGLYARVLAGGYDSMAMVRALGRAADGGHLQVMATDPAEQAVLAPMRLSGALPAAPGAFLAVVMNNAAGNKVDYYLRRKVGYVRTGRRTGRVTVTLTNTVDPTTVPPIVIGRLDVPTEPVDPGQTRLTVSVYVGVGDQVRSVSAGGALLGADLGTERGHGVATVPVEVSPRHPTVLTAEVTDQGGELTYRQQPLVTGDALDLRVPYRLG